MKKKIAISIFVFAAAALLIVSFKQYGAKKANDYAKFLARSIPKSISGPGITDDVQVEKIIKQTPVNMVMLVKWGDNERAYISIDNWMIKMHYYIEIHAVDKNKSMVIME